MQPNTGTYTLPERPKAPNPPAVMHAVAALSMLAALTHLWMMPLHIAVSVGEGFFFAVIAFVHGLYGVAAIRWPTRTVALLGAWGMLALVAFYAAEKILRESSVSHAPHASVLELLTILCASAQLGLLTAFLMDEKMTLYAAEVLSFGVALAYLWEAPERYAGWWVSGVFFVAVGGGGALFCILLPRLVSREGFLLAGVSANLFLVAAWLVTRMVGVPYVRTDGVRSYELRFGATEGVAGVDLFATTMSVSLVVLLASLAMNRRSLNLEAKASVIRKTSIKERRICHHRR